MADSVTPVDRVSIEISASSEDASKKINSLKNALKGLREQTGGMSDQIIDRMKKVVQAVKGLEGANKINISSTLGRNLKNLGDQMNSIPVSAIQKMISLTAALKALETVGKISISSTVAGSLSSIGTAINSLTEEGVQRLISLTYILKALETVGKINLSTKIGDAVKNIADGANAITKTGIDNLTAMVEQLVRLKDVDLKGLSGASAKASKIAQDNEKAQKAGTEKSEGSTASETRKAFDNASSLSRVLKDIGNTMTKNIVPAFRLMGSALKSAVSLVGRLAMSIAKIGLNAVRGAITGIVNAVKTLGRWIGDAAKKVPGLMSSLLGLNKVARTIDSIRQAVSGLARIAMYRLFRSAIKAVTEALNEGSERAYFFAKQYGMATQYVSDALGRISSGSFKMANQLGASWASLIATVQPYIQTLINLVTAAAEALTRLFALLGGKGSYLKAKDYTHAWADETAKGAKAAKEWKNQLLGFDVINRLTEPSSSSGRAGSLYHDYQNMFEEVAVEGGIFDQIKEKIENGDWAGLGRLLGEKFNEVVSNADFAGFGKKIGEKLHAAITTSYTFLKTADFKALGGKIAEMLDNLGDEINFSTLGKLTMRVKTALWDVLYGAFTRKDENGQYSTAKLAERMSDYIKGALDELADWIIRLDPWEISNAISAFFGGVDTEGIKNSLGNVITLAWNKLQGIAHTLFPDGIMPAIGKAIADKFTGMSWTDVYNAIKEKLKVVWTLISQALDVIWPADQRELFKFELQTKLTGILKEAMEAAADAAFELLPRRLRILFADQGDDSAGAYISSMERTIENGKSGVETALDDSVAKPANKVVGDFLARIFHARKAYALEADQINKVSDDVKETGTKDYGDLSKDVQQSISEMQQKLSKENDLVHQGFSRMSELSIKAGETMKEKTAAAWTAIQNSTKAAASAVQEKVKTTWANMKQNTETAWNSIKTDLKNVWSSISTAANTVWSSMQSFLSGVWSAVSADASSAWSSVSASCSGAWSEILSTAGSAASGVVSIVSGMLDSISSGVSSIRGWLSDAIDYAYDAAQNIGSSISDAYDNARNTASTVYTNVSSSVSSAVSNVANKLKNALKNLRFAGGGFPEDGMFFANHSELVGQFSNGRTAVANNRQITEGIAAATYSAFMQAMSDSGGRSGDDRTIVINLDGREIARTTTRYQRQLARAAG